jgi:hypothetical protein
VDAKQEKQTKKQGHESENNSGKYFGKSSTPLTLPRSVAQYNTVMSSTRGAHAYYTRAARVLPSVASPTALHDGRIVHSFHRGLGRADVARRPIAALQDGNIV